jgi:RNA-directed DNA polymerase
MVEGLSQKQRLKVMLEIRRQRHDDLEDKGTSRSQKAMSMEMYRWEQLPWETIERKVFKLQKRIYRASQRGDVKTVHRLQKLLMKSWSAKCLAVRRVTQDNQGKKTAGVDGVKSLTPPQRLMLVRGLKLVPRTRPVRRVWIPKPGTQEKRGLGIPTMFERALQGLVKLALEPEWEAKFEPNSYGFRPGRSCHDAMMAIWTDINKMGKYVLDADIAKCFDRINHEALLKKLSTFPTLRQVIKAWLKAGVMEGTTLFPTEEGTPQGGPISPLLANIALHGLETAIRAAFPKSVKIEGKRIENWQPQIIRYADDFLVLHRDRAVIEQTREITSTWLADMGLELKPSKTRITHTLLKYEGNVGFEFLGWYIRQYPVGKTHTGNTGGTNSQPLGFKTIIIPSQEAVRRHLEKIKETIQKHRTHKQEFLIGDLNRIITGWCNYHCKVDSTQTFTKVTHLTCLKLIRWGKRRHPQKAAQWRHRKYWSSGAEWRFGTPDGKQLLKHADFHQVKHTKVAGTKSPFDGDWSYWATRMGCHPDLSVKKAKLLKRQKGKCIHCGLYFRDGDLLEVDHIIPKSQGGKDVYTNMQLLHRHCHDQKTTGDNSAVGGTSDKSQTIEEPYEGKLSCTVLKPSKEGDLFA